MNVLIPILTVVKGRREEDGWPGNKEETDIGSGRETNDGVISRESEIKI